MARKSRKKKNPSRVADPMAAAFDELAQAVEAAGPALRRLMGSKKPKTVLRAVELAASLAQQLQEYSRANHLARQLADDLRQLRESIAGGDLQVSALREANIELKARLAAAEGGDGSNRWLFGRN